MTKTIHTLDKDIADLLASVAKGKTRLVDPELLAKFGINVAKKLQRSLTAKAAFKRDPHTIYASELGSRCFRQIYYRVNHPELAEPISPHMQIKFFYGDIIEELVLTLAKEAGHRVESEQLTVELDAPITLPAGAGLLTIPIKVRGRIDAIIDGVVVDVKSVSPRGFEEFEMGDGGKKFGYGSQLQVYSEALGIREKGFLVADKQNGHVKYFEDRNDYKVLDKAVVVGAVLTGPMPTSRMFTKPYGTSGNQALCVECQYCPFKKDCWKDSNGGKGLRAFDYSGKPVFMTEVKKEPKVKELTV